MPVIAGALIACGGQDDASVAKSTDDIESAGHDRHYQVVTGLAATEAAVQRATGVVLVPMKDGAGRPMVAVDGTPIRGTCGATFVGRRHALTAAHCVPASDLGRGDTFVIRLIDVTPSVDWRATAKVTGRFPAFETRRVTEGYAETNLTCRVRARCGDAFGPVDCPAGDVDIALVQCDGGLPANRNPAPLATADAMEGPVAMYWFHEIYDVPSRRAREGGADAGDGGGAREGSSTDDDLFAHYTLYRAPEENFHYFGGDRNQIFPLASRPWPSGPRRRLGKNGQGNIDTDLFGCHGTSGSGVFQTNPATGRLELLGPVVTGGTWAGSRLCNDPETARPGEPGLAYAPNEIARKLAALADD